MEGNHTPVHPCNPNPNLDYMAQEPLWKEKKFMTERHKNCQNSEVSQDLNSAKNAPGFASWAQKLNL